MGKRLGIGGGPNSGKSYGRRYIPDGDNVMILAPSKKTTHLFTGPPKAASMTPQQIDEAIFNGTRKIARGFSIKSPEGKYKNIEEAIALIPDGNDKSLETVIASIIDRKAPDYFGGMAGKKLITGSIIHCEKLDNLKMYMKFVDIFMPWVHTIILPDFTHFITEAITDDTFIARKAGNEAYTKYLDLAALSLRAFIKSADAMREELVVVTEYHTTYLEDEQKYVIFTPGGKLLTEKFLPSSYYDTFLFTDVKYQDNEEDMPDYRFVTRKVSKYPEARSIGNFDELYIPNNLQEVLTRIRRYDGIELNNK